MVDGYLCSTFSELLEKYPPEALADSLLKVLQPMDQERFIVQVNEFVAKEKR